MSTRRAERLVNLVICLLSTRQYLPASRIRQAVPGYGDGDDTPNALEAFKRMFERDKAELRDLGVPLETGRNSAFDAEDGYRIARPAYELPEITLEPDESAAVGLATRLWQSAGLAEAANGALLKLRAAGIDVDRSASMALEPRVDAAEPAFPACLAAVTARRPIAFAYRTGGRGAPQPREVEPWGVVSWHGRWYLVGHDRGRDAVRCFRLSRIDSAVNTAGKPGTVTVPTGLDLAAFVADQAPRGRHVARLRIADGAAAGLRRSGRIVGRAAVDGQSAGGQSAGGQSADGRPARGGDVIELEYGDLEALADRVAGYGSGVVVLEPPDVRDAVVRRLRSLAESGQAPADA